MDSTGLTEHTFNPQHELTVMSQAEPSVDVITSLSQTMTHRKSRDVIASVSLYRATLLHVSVLTSNSYRKCLVSAVGSEDSFATTSTDIDVITTVNASQASDALTTYDSSGAGDVMVPSSCDDGQAFTFIDEHGENVEVSR